MLALCRTSKRVIEINGLVLRVCRSLTHTACSVLAANLFLNLLSFLFHLALVFIFRRAWFLS